MVSLIKPYAVNQVPTYLCLVSELVTMSPSSHHDMRPNKPSITFMFAWIFPPMITPPRMFEGFGWLELYIVPSTHENAYEQI